MYKARIITALMSVLLPGFMLTLSSVAAVEASGTKSPPATGPTMIPIAIPPHAPMT